MHVLFIEDGGLNKLSLWEAHATIAVQQVQWRDVKSLNPPKATALEDASVQFTCTT